MRTNSGLFALYRGLWYIIVTRNKQTQSTDKTNCAKPKIKYRCDYRKLLHTTGVVQKCTFRLYYGSSTHDFVALLGEKAL